MMDIQYIYSTLHVTIYMQHGFSNVNYSQHSIKIINTILSEADWREYLSDYSLLPSVFFKALHKS